MAKVSIIIPSRNDDIHRVNSGETVLARMIKDIYEKCTGDFEVLVAFDGPPYQDLPDFPNLRIFHLDKVKGLKHGVNLMANKAQGKYLFKMDSHCMVSEGIDEVLQADMEDNWVVTPRYYILNAEEWKFQNEKFYDYHFVPCPFTDTRMFRFQAGQQWLGKTLERLDVPIDENMKLGGSSFFTSKDFFLNKLGGYREDWIDESFGEELEMTFKTWLGPWDGKLMTNKKCWYAHMTKGRERYRGWRVSRNRVYRTYGEIADYWMKDSWEGAVHPLSWLIEKFWPVPRWEEDWREVWAKWKEEEDTKMCTITNVNE